MQPFDLERGFAFVFFIAVQVGADYCAFLLQELINWRLSEHNEGAGDERRRACMHAFMPERQSACLAKVTLRYATIMQPQAAFNKQDPDK